MIELFLDQMERADVVHIYDPKGSVHDWKLRSQPALQYLGVTDFTYPTSWRQLKHTWEYDKGGKQYEFPLGTYHVLGGLEIEPGTKFGVITTSYYEHQTQYPITEIIDRYTTMEGVLVVVSDKKKFKPTVGERPLYQEPFVETLGRYDEVYAAIKEEYTAAGWNLPLFDTKNLFVQDNAALYTFVTGDELNRTEDLFEVLPETPYLPLYWTMVEIFDSPDVQGSAPLETDETIKAFGGWLRRRIEWDKSNALRIARDLNRKVSNEVGTFNRSYARRSVAFQEARSRQTDLNPTENHVDKKYHAWLTSKQQ
ncbi:hypothetical protein [Haladaptatus sp. YSMS36]|uniref:hypothetical protein n=1 Tax=Haladaptatus sp. YSMS36 TaxID=3033384 RepID=UPI0023E7E587|nr:hypothetical protein [Haladaptatus sp. YSMS36]